MKKSVKILGALAGAGLLACGLFGLCKKDEEEYVEDYPCDPVEEQTEENDEKSDEE